MSAPGNASYCYCAPKAALTTANTAQHMLNLQAGTEGPAPTLVEFGVSCNGTTSTFMVVELTLNKAEGVAETTGTATLLRGIAGSKPRSTIKAKYTEEPKNIEVVRRWEIPIPCGPFVLQFPLGREPMPSELAAKTFNSIGLRITVITGTPSISSYMEWEE